MEIDNHEYTRPQRNQPVPSETPDNDELQGKQKEEEAQSLLMKTVFVAGPTQAHEDEGRSSAVHLSHNNAMARR